MNKKIFYVISCICLVSLAVFLFYYIKSVPKVDEAKVIKVGYRAGNLNYGPFYVADMKNYFKERDVIIEAVPLGSSNDLKLAISMGQIDIALSAVTVFFVPISKGVPIKIVAPMAVGPIHLFVRDSKIKTFEDIIGKSIAVTQGGPSEIYVRYVLGKENIDASKVNFVYIDKVYRPSALMDKKIVDAVPIGEDEVEKYSEIGAVSHEEWEAKGYTMQIRLEEVIAINEEFNLAQPLLVEKFIDSIIEGHRFIKSNPDEASQIVSSYIKVESEAYTPEYIKDIWENNKLAYILWCDPTTLVDMSRIAVESGQIESNLTLEQIFDSRFEEKLKRAQNEIYSTD